jgi:hypothetical protein
MSKPERLSEIDQAAANITEFEGAIREFVRRDVSLVRRPRSESTHDGAADNINSVIERAAEASVDEINRVISELQDIREVLRNEGDRVQRDVANYGGMCQAAMASMKVIADSLSQWRPNVRQLASHAAPRHEHAARSEAHARPDAG